MHTLKVISVGFAILAICLFCGRLAANTRGMAFASITFVPLWLVLAGANMYMGVKGAGYSVAEELPVFVLVFALPAIAATLLWWKLR